MLNDNSFIIFGVSYNGVNFYFCEDGLVSSTYGWVWSGLIRIFDIMLEKIHVNICYEVVDYTGIQVIQVYRCGLYPIIQ